MSLLSRVVGGLFKKQAEWKLSDNTFYSNYIIERAALGAFDEFEVPALMAAAFRLCEGVAAMPIIHGKIQHLPNGMVNKTPDPKSVLTRLLTNRPNDFMTSVEFVETVTLNAILFGEGQAYIKKRAGKPHSFIPLPTALIVEQDPDTGEVTYSGAVPGFGHVEHIPRRDLIIISQPRQDPVSPTNVKTARREIIKTANAQQKRLGDDALIKKIRGILTFKDALSDQAAEKVIDALKDKLPDIPILDTGADYKELLQSSADIQLSKAVSISIENIARAVGIHPLLIGHDAGGQSLTRVLDVLDYHVQISLGPWVRRWEAALKFSLLEDTEYIDFDEAQYIRMNLSDRTLQATQALGSGGGQPFKTLNEVRAQFGKNPVPGGDKLAAPQTVSEIEKEVANATQADE